MVGVSRKAFVLRPIGGSRTEEFSQNLNFQAGPLRQVSIFPQSCFFQNKIKQNIYFIFFLLELTFRSFLIILQYNSH